MTEETTTARRRGSTTTPEEGAPPIPELATEDQAVVKRWLSYNDEDGREPKESKQLRTRNGKLYYLPPTVGDEEVDAVIIGASVIRSGRDHSKICYMAARAPAELLLPISAQADGADSRVRD